MSGSDRSTELFARLLKDRIVFLGTPIDDDVANTVMGQLLYLESEAPGKQATIYINSPGGSVTAALAIHRDHSTTSGEGRGDHGCDHLFLRAGGEGLRTD